MHKFRILYTVSIEIETKISMLLVDLNYNFEFDWFVELSNNKLCDNKLCDIKLSDNNLASELVRNSSFLSQLQLRKL